MLNKLYKNESVRTIKTGDIFWVDLGNPGGSLQGGKRPCVITSNNKNNLNAPTVFIVPLSRKIQKKLPVHVKLEGSKYNNAIDTSLALCEQGKTINKYELGDYATTLDIYDLKRVLYAMCIQTGCVEYNVIEDQNKDNVIDFTFIKSKIDIITEADNMIKKYGNNKELLRFTLMNKNCAIAELKKYCEEKSICYNRLENIITKGIVIKNEEQLKMFI